MNHTYFVFCLLAAGLLTGPGAGTAQAYEYDPLGRTLSVTHDPATATLRVTGNGGHNLIYVRADDNGALFVNGVGVLASLADTELVEIDGAGGDDILVAGRLPAAALAGGGGADYRVWYDTEGLVVVADDGGPDPAASGALGNDWIIGGTAIDGLFPLPGDDLLASARLLRVGPAGLILVRGLPAEDDVVVDGRIVTGNTYEHDGDFDLFLVDPPRAYPGGENHLDVYLATGPYPDSGPGLLDLFLVAALSTDTPTGDDGDLDLYLVNAPGGDNSDVDGDGDLDVLAVHGVLRRAPCPDNAGPRLRPGADCVR